MQKGEEGGGSEQADEAAENRGDQAEGLPGTGGAAMSRRENAATRADRTRPEGSFTPLAGDEQPSAWSRTALYGGGTALAALILALGYATLRPTPRGRRRSLELPAPAWARAERRRG